MAKHLKDLGVEPSVDEFQLLVNILTALFPTKSALELGEILALRGLSDADSTLFNLPDDVVDNLVDKGDQKDAKDFCAHICTSGLRL